MPTGIVLMGGRSTRMGMDKALIAHAGSTFAERTKALLSEFCDDVYFSTNANQTHYDFVDQYITDRVEDQGPVSAILSCLDKIKGPVLTVAVDQIALSSRAIEQLLDKRDTEALATVYYNTTSKLWEATVGIWEIACFRPLQQYFDNGGRSLQRFLNTHNIQKVEVVDSGDFLNVNRPDDLKEL